VRLRAEPLREPRFVLDAHLGRLARYLRLLGFDALYRPDFADDQLSRISSGERRILLPRRRAARATSRDPRLLRLEPVAKEAVADRVPADVYRSCDDFPQCPACRRVYWKGSHHERLARLVEEVAAASATPDRAHSRP
jgi:uncharacterized protein with PIN domain